MSVTLSGEKNELVKQIAKSQGFDDYTVTVASGSMKGDGYLGIIYTVDIQDNNDSRKQLQLIMKSALTEEKLREVSPIRHVYEREIYLYKVVFPELALLSQEAGITHKFCGTAKYYGSLIIEKEECIVLENLKELNFKLWNRRVPMNEEHVALVFETYARFHGSGLILKYLKPEKYEELSKNLYTFQPDQNSEEGKKQLEESVKYIFTNGFNAVANDEKATQGLNKFVQSSKTFFLEEVTRVDKYCTILHGDCWCNNMMFKYSDVENPTKPTEACLLDWQISRTGSPIFDLSYFFYASVSGDVLYKLKDFLKIYHQSLSKIVKEAGLNPDDVLTYDELEKQWHIYSKHGLFMTLFVMKVILSEVDEAPDLSEIAKSFKRHC